MRKQCQFTCTLLAALTLAACSSNTPRNSGMPGLGAGGSSTGNGGSAQTQGVSGVSGFSAQSFSSGGLNTLSQQDQAQLNSMAKVVYFSFDSNTLSSEGQQAAQQNANFLLQHPAVSVLLAGHTDPRGSQEYNFHLGERRADAVKNYFLQQGVAAAQICTVSYGELKPAASPQQFNGNWQKAYQLDRRVEIEYGQVCQGQTPGAL